jgi:hypothetical protein
VPSRDRPCTAVTPSAVHGKEGVVGSSPTPGLAESLNAGAARRDRSDRSWEGCPRLEPRSRGRDHGLPTASSSLG